jgi:glycosyltransferase involved in cell wall biosynthesis
VAASFKAADLRHTSSLTMPAISLVVCMYRERELLKRLLESTRDCIDDLVVTHDGPDVANAREVVEEFGGRFFEHPRIGSLEGQSPFAWAQAKHEWILRLDADEFPSPELKAWIQNFRSSASPSADISGFTCIWPLWNGRRVVTPDWPRGRIFLFNKQAVSFFGLPEQVPIPEGRYEAVPLVLCHQPNRTSYGIRNIVFRPQATRWRALIAEGLLGQPSELPCWRWAGSKWPAHWEQLRRTPLWTGLLRLFLFPIITARQMQKAGYWPRPGAVLNSGLHHSLIGWELFRAQRRKAREAKPVRKSD